MDANILFSAAKSDGAVRALVKLLLDEGHECCADAYVVAEARRYIGGNPTGRGSLWCARFMNMVLQRSGHRGTGSDMARSGRWVVPS